MLLGLVIFKNRSKIFTLLTFGSSNLLKRSNVIFHRLINKLGSSMGPGVGKVPVGYGQCQSLRGTSMWWPKRNFVVIHQKRNTKETKSEEDLFDNLWFYWF